MRTQMEIIDEGVDEFGEETYTYKCPRCGGMETLLKGDFPFCPCDQVICNKRKKNDALDNEEIKE